MHDELVGGGKRWFISLGGGEYAWLEEGIYMLSKGGYILSQYYKGGHIISYNITHLRWQHDAKPPVRVGEGGIYYHSTIRGIISYHITSPTSDGRMIQCLLSGWERGVYIITVLLGGSYHVISHHPPPMAVTKRRSILGHQVFGCPRLEN